MVEAWDAIVVGSGIGGLSAAGLLARVAKMRVLLLEKHWERGGQTHVFRRDGASWDVGVHYIGELQRGSMMRTLFDFLSDGALEWNCMPDEFERFVYPGLDFSVPSDPQRYEARLIARFPDEAGAIRRYFRDLRTVASWHVLGIQQQVMPAPLAFLLAQWRRLGAAKATQTTGEYLKRHFRSPQLKALLATQWGDYGLPPSESAFAMHALVVGSYFNGAWFPQGGAGRIARTFELGVEARGGAIKVRHEVTAILTEGGRAVGVKALDRRGGEPAGIEFRAPIVVSDVGARNTYRRLLPTDGEIGRRTATARAYVDAVSGGLSAVMLYLQLDKPVHPRRRGRELLDQHVVRAGRHRGGGCGDLGGRAAPRLSVVPVRQVGRQPFPHRRDRRVHAVRRVPPPGAAAPADEAWQQVLRRTERSHFRKACCGSPIDAVPGLSKLVALQPNCRRR